jgi:hypothetical protein
MRSHEDEAVLLRVSGVQTRIQKPWPRFQKKAPAGSRRQGQDTLADPGERDQGAKRGWIGP